MPHTTIIREEFAEAVKKVLGGLSANQASYKTGVSDEYIRKMSAGRVPSEVIIERFATGLGFDPRPLLVAAGYEQPADAFTAIVGALRATDNIPEQGKQQILDFVKKVEKKYKGDSQ